MTLVQILASHWRSFISVAGALFAAFALAVILLVPGRLVLIRSSIDIGNYVIRGDTSSSPFYPAEQLAKRALDVYMPSTLSTMSKAGTSTRTLRALQNSSIESNGLSIVIATTLDASGEDAARKFQESLASLIVSGEMSRVKTLGEAAAARTAAAEAPDHDKQISRNREQIDRIDKRMAEIEKGRRDQETELASLLQRQQSTSQSNEQVSAEARIRQLQEQLAAGASALNTLAIQRNSFVLALGTAEQSAQEQRVVVVERRFEQKAFTEPRVSLPPTAVLITFQWRQAGLLAIAFVASLLIAFAAIAGISNVQAWHHQNQRRPAQSKAPLEAALQDER